MLHLVQEASALLVRRGSDLWRIPRLSCSLFFLGRVSSIFLLVHISLAPTACVEVIVAVAGADVAGCGLWDDFFGGAAGTGGGVDDVAWRGALVQLREELKWDGRGVPAPPRPALYSEWLLTPAWPSRTMSPST